MSIAIFIAARSVARRAGILFAVAALLLAPFALAHGAPGVAMAAAMLWVGITGALVIKCLRDTSKRLRHVAEMVVTSALIPPLAVFWRIVGAIRYRTWLA